MTILIKYPRQSLKRNKEWVKRMEEKNINWAQWGGWFDSDGSFGKAYNKKNKVRICGKGVAQFFLPLLTLEKKS